MIAAEAVVKQAADTELGRRGAPFPPGLMLPQIPVKFTAA
jgi:hypothetical protein